MRGKWEEIERLVKKARDGDEGASKELLRKFEPLIQKISSDIWLRYRRVIPLDEIKENAKQLALAITLLDYRPRGPAKYPHFLKTYLHAKLVQMFRPTAVFRYRTTSLEEALTKADKSPYDVIYEHERQYIAKKVWRFINSAFTEQEKAIAIAHICGDLSRNRVAEIYNVSYMRMKHVHQRSLNKLRKFMKKLGIREGDI